MNRCQSRKSKLRSPRLCSIHIEGIASALISIRRWLCRWLPVCWCAQWLHAVTRECAFGDHIHKLVVLVEWARYIHMNDSHAILRGLFRISRSIAAVQFKCSAKCSMTDSERFDVDAFLAVVEEFRLFRIQ
jgi:hypothetical protein